MIIDSRASVRHILAHHPETAPVFARHGLTGCGGPAGPDEPLDFFARAHDVPVAALVAELEEAAARRPSRAPAAPAPQEEPARRFVPFFVGALALTLTFGATLGMINLARLTGTGWGSLSRPSVWAHGYVQVFGFVGLFVMGVAYHVIPRFVGAPLHAARLSVWSFRLQLAGVLAIATGFLFMPSAARPLWIGGAAALVAAAICFRTSIAGTVRAGRRRSGPEPFERWLQAGMLWLAASAGIALAGAIADEVAWHHVLWPAALFGFAASWIFGVGRRIFPIFLEWEPRWPRIEKPAFLAYQIAVVAWSVGAWPGDGPFWPVLRGAGAVLLVASALLVGGVLGVPVRRVPRLAPPSDAPYERYIYAAWGWLLVGLLSGPLWTAGALASGSYGSILMADFSRHALGFGFVTQMIMGVATRVVPVFTGRRLWSRRAGVLAFWLLNGAMLLRALEAPVAAGIWPGAWPLIALSGPPGVAAVLLFAINMVMTVRVGGRREAPRPASRAEVPDRTVAELLRTPGVLAVLLDAGFTPLRNPALRAAFAGTVTLRQACRLRNVELAPLAARIDALVAGSAPRGRPVRRIPLAVAPGPEADGPGDR